MRTLQRNGIFYDLLYAALLVWNPEYGSEDFPELDTITMQQLYREFAPKAMPEFEILNVTHTVQTNIKYQLFFDGFMLDEEHFKLGQKLRKEYGSFFRQGLYRHTDHIAATPAGVTCAWYDLPGGKAMVLAANTTSNPGKIILDDGRELPLTSEALQVIFTTEKQ